MKTNEITLSEAAMNPSEFGHSLDQATSSGVLVGFEFEFCIPKNKIHEILNEVYANNSPEAVSSILSGPKSLRKLGLLDIQTFLSVIRSVSGISTVELYKKYIDTTLGAFIQEYNRAPPELLKLINKTISQISTGDRLPTSLFWLKEVLELGHRKDELVYMLTMLKLSRIANFKTESATWRSQFVRLIDAVRFALNLLKTPPFLQALINQYGNINENLDKYDIDLKSLMSAFRIADRTSDAKYMRWDDMAGAMTILSKKYLNTTPVVFDSYHERQKNAKNWYIEPDGSLAPTREEIALEFVSPPMDPITAIRSLQIFYQMASDYEFKTSKSRHTGCHINVSIPEKIDLAKLAVFTGDQYILQQFGREKSQWAHSVYSELKSKPFSTLLRYTDTDDIIDDISRMAMYTMNNHSASISAERDKKFISFRGVGHDYLSQFNNVANATGRFVRALLIASNPNAYKKEYFQKIYKLLYKDKRPSSTFQKIKSKLDDLKKQYENIKNAKIPTIIIDFYIRDSEINRKFKHKHPSIRSHLGIFSNLKFKNAGLIVQTDERQEIIDNFINSFDSNDVIALHTPNNIEKSKERIKNSNSLYRVTIYPKTTVGIEQIKKVIDPLISKKFLSHVYNDGFRGRAYAGWKLITINSTTTNTEIGEEIKNDIKTKITDLIVKLKNMKFKRRKLPESTELNVNSPIYYFAYGMLTNNRLMRNLNARKIGKAELPNFKFELLGHANIHQDINSSCQGVLWRVDEDTIRYLDDIEGVPNYYDRKMVKVYYNGKAVNAWVYFMTDESRAISYENGYPSKRYVNDIANGYRSANISLAQLNAAITELNSRFDDENSTDNK
jgi:gamma-glutamylcyclotransferase (GGCT)/AIG2-like uncharacterized protein YtfP